MSKKLKQMSPFVAYIVRSGERSFKQIPRSSLVYYKRVGAIVRKVLIKEIP